MTIDFNKLMPQIGQVGVDSLSESMDEHETILNANEAFDEAVKVAEKFAQRLKDNEGQVLWPLAQPLERFGNSYEIKPRVNPVTVLAVDGSQIMPSHHEVHACYLLNIGLAIITYDAKHPPVLESIPLLYHRPEDLYPLVDRRRVHIDELFVSLERTLLELETLLQRALACQERDVPVFAFYDGSLISWSADKLPDAYRTRFMERMSNALTAFDRARIPIIGYLSHSRSSEVVNILRVSVCPYDESRCRTYCGHLNEEDFPCSKVWPLSDRQLFFTKLQVNSRTSVFKSGANAAKSLPERNQICFAYLNTGHEIARIEFPIWLFADGQLFNSSISTVLAQSQKGMGYPVCLAEAHHLAVIKSQDRERFFELMSRHLVELGVRRIHVSPKESKKRTGFV